MGGDAEAQAWFPARSGCRSTPRTIPLKYIDFEGVIPAGQYGGGTMIVWDQGRWIPEGDPHADYARGRLTFTLEGERLKGKWHLVRTRGKPGKRNEQWLLLKSDDEAARTSDDPDILEEETTSLKSGRTIEELAAQGDIRIDHAAREKVARIAGRQKSRRPLEGQRCEEGHPAGLCRAGVGKTG